ncbi:hypothetical protein ACOEKU_005436, partial [Escherichia coli]|nr:hypothetical protein [Escherichia coli]
LARFRAAATVRCLKNQACSDRSGRAAPVAPETALPAHLTVCKATAPDGAVNPSAATPAACFPLWTFRGLKRPQHGAAVQGKMYQPQNFLPQASKTFASAPGQLPRDVVSVPHRKGPLREEPPVKWTAEGASLLREMTRLTRQP